MSFTIDKPIYLIIYLLIPFIWIMMKRSSAGDRLSKQKLVIGLLRSFLVIVLGLAISDPKFLSHSDQVNVFFCLDVSESIPALAGMLSVALRYVCACTSAATPNRKRENNRVFNRYFVIVLFIR